MSRLFRWAVIALSLLLTPNLQAGTNTIRGLKGQELIDYVNSIVIDGKVVYAKYTVFHELLALGPEARAFTQEMIQLARISQDGVTHRHMSLVNADAIKVLVSIGSDAAVPVARSMHESESTFWPGQQALLGMKTNAAPSIPILKEMITNRSMPNGRTKRDVNLIIYHIYEAQKNSADSEEERQIFQRMKQDLDLTREVF